MKKSSQIFQINLHQVFALNKDYVIYEKARTLIKMELFPKNNTWGGNQIPLPPAPQLVE